MLEVRRAVLDDAPDISAMLQALVAVGKRTRPSDEIFVREYYVGNPNGVSCFVALLDGRISGLQALSYATPGNPYGAAEGHGIIGTHVGPWAARKGVGRALFNATCDAAREARLIALEAFIQEVNDEGLAYYGAMGFETFRKEPPAIVKLYRL